MIPGNYQIFSLLLYGYGYTDIEELGWMDRVGLG